MKSDRDKPVMLPPDGFVERAVAVGLAQVALLEAIQSIHPESGPRRRRDSGVIPAPAWSDDAPTLPFFRVQG